ncbi:MAG: phenylalanine--tRNA ligase subunit beta [Mycobacteriales bacterium]
MRVPLLWLRDYVDLPESVPVRDLGAALTRAGFEIEGIDEVGAELAGPIVVGRVARIEKLTGFNKPIRYCQVDVGEASPRGIVCGATNFAVGDRVVVSLPGAVLPGGFAITARATYGHTSDGMICSARELGLGEDHSGILVLGPDIAAEPGTDALTLLPLRETVLDVGVTPDRGYAESIRGIAREVSLAFEVPFRDPAAVAAQRAGAPVGDGWPARIEDAWGCDRFALQTMTDLDPDARSPLWLQARLARCGIRAISLAVDVTNYVMLELGQPLHAYDAHRLAGTVVVRRARPGELVRTLDGVERTALAEDVLITDDSGPIGLAGVMGGASTEISAASRDIVLEAAHFNAAAIGRTLRRHKAPSEASKRFERSVDPEVAGPALDRAASLLAELGGTKTGGRTVVTAEAETATVAMDAGLPSRVAGVDLPVETVRRRLTGIGCTVDGGSGAPAVTLTVSPPTWRPDLRDPFDLVEEIVRLEGIESIPPRLPRVPAGRGLTAQQRERRSIGRGLADAGYVEVRPFPFMSAEALDALGLGADDPRRRALAIVNPVDNTEPLLRTMLLPGLLAALRRNVSRGLPDVGLFEQGPVFRPRESTPPAPSPGVDAAPPAEVIAAFDAALPQQPQRVAIVVTGRRELPGPDRPARAADWTDAVAVARQIAAIARVPITVAADEHAPWHPGRCAVVRAGDRVVGHAGELHPAVIAAMELPARTCAAEIDLDALGIETAPVAGATVSAYPPAHVDVALIVADDVPQSAVQAALRDGAGDLAESVELFDVYRGGRIGEGRKSLAYSLRFRADDRTLTAEEANNARDAAVRAAESAVGARLRA